MINKNENLIQDLFEVRKNENRRVHEQYVHAMELKNDDDKNKMIIHTILSDLPEDGNVISHNLD